jgi:uncharacterized repeat protein (TIGR01451 family)
MRVNRSTQFLTTGVARLISVLAVCFLTGSVLAATPAGTTISNQASAVYKDEFGNEHSVTSNVVETVVEQVAGLELTQDQQQLAEAGTTVYFSHRLVNIGNGDDRFDLSVNNRSGDSIDLNALAIYLDADQNGVADNNTPITTTPWIGASNDLYLVVAGTIPSGAGLNDAARIQLTANSQFSTSLSDFNTDTVNVDIGAIVVFTKSMSSNSGNSPSGPYTVTLDYENTGTSLANEVVLIDALPEGMQYVPGSGRWSATTEVLSDSDPNDFHTAGSNSIRYCAYDNSCTNLPESQIDADISSVNQVTAVVSLLAPGESGSLSFDIEVDPLLPAGVLVNQAEMQFDTGGITKPRTFGNSVSFNVLQSASVVANGSEATAIDGMNEPVSINSAPLVGTVVFKNVIWNTGTTTDTFNIEVDTLSTTFPANTIYRLLRSDAVTPLQDTNSDGTVDTGPVLPGAYAIVNLEMQLPFGFTGNNNGAGFDIEKTAISVADTSVSNSVVDHLDEIVSNQVDLTNQSPAGSAGALGVGPGPELSPVSTVNADSNGVALFDLYIRHQGAGTASYDLSAHADANANALPANWEVEFSDAQTGNTISNTGLLSSGESTHVVAKVMVPADANNPAISIYFRARSPVNGASDIKHDAMLFQSSPQLQLEPSLSAYVAPNGFVIYEHLVTNPGSAELNDIVFTQQQSVADWQSILYADTDGNGQFSSADQPITQPLILSPGASAELFLKVIAPVGVSVGQNNVTELVASSAAEGLSAQISDNTTVSINRVSIRKEQAVDVGCDGQPDPGTDFSPAKIDVAPGNNCILYKLTATNDGIEPSFNVVIRDSTPPYTLYYPSAVCSRTPCWINEPDLDETGTINAETDQLLPGDSYHLQFSVRIE